MGRHVRDDRRQSAFVHYLAFSRGGWKNCGVTPVRFLALVAGVVVLICIQLITRHGYALPEAIRLSAFNTVSMMTGTGYGSADFNAWGGSATSCY